VMLKWWCCYSGDVVFGEVRVIVMQGVVAM